MAETTRSGMFDFFSDVMEQVRKVTWPDWSELRESTGVIVVFVLVVALVIFGMDQVVHNGLQLVTSLFTG